LQTAHRNTERKINILADKHADYTDTAMPEYRKHGTVANYKLTTNLM